MHSYLPVWLPRSFRLLLESTDINGQKILRMPTDMLIMPPRAKLQGSGFETNFTCEFCTFVVVYTINNIFNSREEQDQPPVSAWEPFRFSAAASGPLGPRCLPQEETNAGSVRPVLPLPYGPAAERPGARRSTIKSILKYASGRYGQANDAHQPVYIDCIILIVYLFNYSRYF